LTAKILDGKRVAQEIRNEVKERAKPLIARGVVPGLAAVLVGDDPASRLYVRSKTKACEEAGLFSEGVLLPGSTSREELQSKLDELNGATMSTPSFSSSRSRTISTPRSSSIESCRRKTWTGFIR
jgi:5,10-methylene-tetrahydrofolate dehydrogenase/methenyl tetrahydrofolate cyclohydrolase